MSPVFSRWPIRLKVLVGLGLLLLLVACLSSSGLYATYTYRSLAKSLSWRAAELPLAAELNAHVRELRNSLSELRGIRSVSLIPWQGDKGPLQLPIVRVQFASELDKVESTLARYRQQLEHKSAVETRISDNQQEWQTVRKIESALQAVRAAHRTEDWMDSDATLERLDVELDQLQSLSDELPSHLYRRLGSFADEIRGQYRALIVGTWLGAVSAAVVLLLFIKLFYHWVLQPLRVLIGGSRRVAAGEFGYRIQVDSEDEMAELADAMNRMTSRFRAIRDDLDRQVQERTKQVIRNEQLASVGFLAAGVAHEINNPLASIALCAESLEGRVRGLLDPENPDHAVIGNYLRMIQEEAFRCKDITEKLLDFSRTGETQRQQADLVELARDVVAMLAHLGKYQNKHVEIVADEPVIAPVNVRQIKQVLLNLLTNALDCSEEQGHVRVELSRQDDMAELSVSDNGCGMEPEVLDRVFEPFFTRRKVGQGTGLGLSITHRIVADHGGAITARSDGPGRGATFQVCLPLAVPEQHKEIHHRYQAA